MLTDEQINAMADRGVFFGHFHDIARAIEAEVQKQDTELIRQMHDAMLGVKNLNMGGELALWTAEFDRLLSAIAAAKQRLGEP